MIAHSHTFSAVLEPDDEAGGFFVNVPALPGCHTQGDTREDAIAMAQDAIVAYVESLVAHNEPIPTETAPVGSVQITIKVSTKVAVETISPAAA